ncbi:MAG: repair protein NreA [Candidatus Woesearchaeota archaeon]|nr:repair protein NreA [Candidatus Woesearchaeota archaeon]
MDIDCVFCKGRLYCGRKYCPIQAKIYYKKGFQQKISTNKKEFFGESPNVFVSRFNYPNINVGSLSVEKYDKHDEPKQWSKESLPIKEVIKKRVQLVNSYVKTNALASRKRNKLFDSFKEISLSKKPVETEVKFRHAPKFNLNFDQTITPFGPNAKMENVRIVSNPKIPHSVEKIANDELKAHEAVSKLSRRFDVYYITKVFSTGLLGNRINSKFVPTRWSITAVDDITSRNLISNVLKYNQIEEPEVYVSGDYGNYFLAIFLPGTFKYELFEIPVFESNFSANREPLRYTTNYESSFGRKEYAKETAGGYYAARLSLLQHLEDKKKQASVLLIRFITKEYWAPLGVWVVRETVKKVLNTKPLRFSSNELALEFAKKYALKYFSTNLNSLLKRSKLLQEINSQRQLKSFLK